MTDQNKINKSKRALVLSGGGAKGAYEFGCLKAFSEVGIEFDVVAGTSVGALNAICWSTDNLKKGEDIWNNLSFKNSYDFNIPFNNKLKLWIVYPIAIIIVCWHVLIKVTNRSYIPINQSFKGFVIYSFFLNIASIALNSPGFILIYLVDYTDFLFDKLILCYLVISCIIMAWGLSKRDLYASIKITKRLLQFNITAFSMACFFIIYLSLAPEESIWNALFPLYLLIWGLVFSKTLNIIILALDNMKGHIMTNRPLKNHVSEILSNSNFNVQTYITVAEDRAIFLPDKQSYLKNILNNATLYTLDNEIYNSIDSCEVSLFEIDDVYFVENNGEYHEISYYVGPNRTKYIDMINKIRKIKSKPARFYNDQIKKLKKVRIKEDLKNKVYQPNSKKFWVPVYKRLDLELNIKKRINYLLASAAIPFGLIKEIEIDNRIFVDGGIIDNVPIFPVLANHPDIEEIFVILLHPFQDHDESIEFKKLSEIANLYEQAKKGIPRPIKFRNSKNVLKQVKQSIKETHKVKNSNSLQESFKSSSIKWFCPQKSLGGWFDGTLNFSSDYSRKLVKLGYEDTLNKIQKRI